MRPNRVSDQVFTKQSHLLAAFPGDTGDVDVYGRGRRDVALGVAGGLEALKLVQGLVEALPYPRFVAGLILLAAVTA